MSNTLASSAGQEPIFVHASARSGSTYVFNVFRRNPALLCFNEAIIDGKRDYARFRKDQQASNRHWDVNHHFLDRADYDEFIEAWDEVMHLCPEFPTFQDYLPRGVLAADLAEFIGALIGYARAQGKRPVLCEINSRGRAGALRGTFGGFHIAQYRDPISQFGSYVRALVEGGSWGFLVHPVTELGVNSAHPLCRVVPAVWRAPDFGWKSDTRAERWASDARYTAAMASRDPAIIEKLFRWHLFAWVLNNLAALAYSDLGLDIDKAHDDVDYRATFVNALAGRVGARVDLNDVEKYSRYYRFETFDVAAVCGEVEAAIRASLGDGRLEAALRTLGREAPVVPTASAAELLLRKINESLATMARSADGPVIGAEQWRALAEKNRKIWFNPTVQRVARHVYPVAAPVVQVARRMGLYR
jgi:hypothetical protein